MEYHQCDETVKQKVFWYSVPKTKNWIFIRNCANFAKYEFFRILKIIHFHRSGSCLNQTKLGMEYQQCNESVKLKVFLVNLVRKKFSISYGQLFGLREKWILKKIFFIGSRSCPNQTKRCVEYDQCNESVKKWNTLSGKKLVFNTELFEFREKGNSKKVLFIGLRSCPNQTKGVMEIHQCKESVKQKILWYSLPRKKIGFSYGILRISRGAFFANFKN